MKKFWIALCCVVLAAAIALGVTISGKNDAQTKLTAANSQVTDLQSKLDSALKGAEDTKAALEADAAAAAETAAKALEDAKAEAEAAAKAAADKAAEELAAAKAEAETAAKAAADKAAEELAAVKAEAEAAAAKAAEELAAAKAEAETAAKAAADKAAEELAAVKAEAEAAAEALKAAKSEVTAATSAAIKAGAPYAYIMYANADWSQQFWGDPVDGINAKTVLLQEYGAYTVGLEFDNESAGLAFAALGIKNGEKAMPGTCIKINAIRVNGEAIDVKKGYTSSDDKVETRMNLYNEWVSELPADARSFDGSTEGASPVIVDKEAFAAVKSVEIDFELVPLTAYIMYANADWSVSYWNDGAETPVVALNAPLMGEGTYTVALDFTKTEAGSAAGLAFTAVGIKGGETYYPGYCIDVKEIKVNGEAIQIGKAYTSSDDKIETRANLYNEWVAALPEDARRADGNLDGAAPIIVDKEAFADVKTVEVTFDFVPGKAPAAAAAADAAAPLTEDEITAIKAGKYNAYTGIQTEKYTFRNEWSEANYGRDSEANPGYFNRLTGWDADNNAVDFGGTFEDALIDHNGEYTVTMTTGDMGFAEGDSKIRMLFVSTEIPSRAIDEGIIAISDVKVKFGDGRTQAYTEITTSGTYARITLLDEYNQSSEPVAYTMPIGPNTPIAITFTVSGLAE